MKIIKDSVNLIAIAETSESFPDDTSIGEGTMLHFVDTGEEYIYHEGMWELDLRRARELGMV